MNHPLLFRLLLCLLFQMVNGCPSNCVCSDVSSSAQCDGGNLGAIVREVSADTKQLTMTSVSVTGPLSFSNLPNLEVLSLTRSRIYKIAATAFSGLDNLQHLDLSHNGITDIEKEAFSGLYQLTYLDLSHNKIAKLDRLFYNQHLLEFLSLAWNDLNELLTGLFRAQLKLQSLILDGNRFRHLHSYSFQGLQNLLNLSLSNCWLSEMHQDFFGITRSLVSLDYSSNQIQQVLPSRQLQNLPYLRLLSLHNNTITHLNDLQFSGVKLDTLNLSNNRIRKISDLMFKYFNTRVLDLSKNAIDTLTSGSLRPTAPQLEYLSLAENPLSDIPREAFQGLYRLLELNLSDCSIHNLHVDQFTGPNGLQKLDVSMNYLKNVHSSVLKFFSRLEFVNLEGNYWSCDCHIGSLRDWLHLATTAGKLFCARRDGGKCPPLECMSPLSLYQQTIAGLKNEQIKSCDVGDGDRETSLTTILAVVASSIAFVIIVCVCGCILWKWASKNGNLKWLCNKSAADSSHLDKSNKPRPFEDMDIGSLNESDRSFNVRNYFNSMVQNNPGSLSRGTPSYSQKEIPSHLGSHLGSQQSLYSIVSNAYGRESTV